MSRKLDFVPYIPNYNWVREQMYEDLKYRLESRTTYTKFGRPLYLNPNVQIIVTQECPYSCWFCLERQNPMEGYQDFEKQISSLKDVLSVHPTARLTVTGGEPSLYLSHVKNLIDVYKDNSDNKFAIINTTGYDEKIKHLGKLNISVNECVSPDLNKFPDAIYQTILEDDNINIFTIKNIMESNIQKEYSFRFLTDISGKEYNTNIFNELQNDKDIKIKVFRIGDFFVYLTFEYNNKKARITLGDMFQQQNNNYLDGYSNIIIHPDGNIGLNWK